MIRFERGRLPRGTRAFARRDDGGIVVLVSADLRARERLSAIREALGAAPAAGWRSPRSPVLLPALAGCAGLRRAPEGRWAYRAAVAAVVVAVLAAAVPLAAVAARPGDPGQQAALQPGGPLPAGPATGSSPSPAARGPGTGRHRSGQGSPPAQPGPAPGAAPEPAKTTPTSARGPAPQSSGTPAPVPSESTTPQPSPSQAPSPSPSPRPAKQSGGSEACIGLLVVTLCL